eukprot:TRINITY_DN8147_c0_g2_i1.p1 TRINITY_DN8147_c0_g2~~TRINITY_DN8147_c0_g2_i1.p1  ORF type:complete len:812 (+),score=300.90 TRINITY_DN8147_c0_g2_i1:81-2438(+)
MASSRLPLMPGTNELVHGDLLRSNYRRCQVLTRMDGGEQPREPRPVGPDPDNETDTFVMKEFPHLMHSIPPAHLGFDRKVLRFKAYFREGVHESRLETLRHRQCLLYYFLEDDSAAVVEPRTQNSGMNQGTIVKRHKIPLADKTPLKYTHLRLGSNITLYGKNFRIYDCDSFTREYCTQVNHDLGEAEPAPFDEKNMTTGSFAGKSRGAHQIKVADKLSTGQTGAAGGSTATRQEVLQTTQFLRNDRKVLRFKAIWDEFHHIGANRRAFNLYYFLSDDCIEIIEMLPHNSGRDPFPSFIRRRKCPKKEKTTTVLDLKAEVDTYTDADLYLGAELTICGKRFLLCDCDAFTREFLTEEHGRCGPELEPIDYEIPAKQVKKAPPPPHNGFGDEEDSLRSCKQLATTCPVKDIRKFVEEGDQCVRFSMERCGEADRPADRLRKFVLTYYISDDTLSIFEAVARNSGVLGGRFLQRQRVKGNTNPANFYVGAQVTISHTKFRVTATDERSLNYMEYHSKTFLKSNLNLVMAKLWAMATSKRTGLGDWLRGAEGEVTYEGLLERCQKLGLPVVEQEVITVMRYISTRCHGGFSYKDFESLLMKSTGMSGAECDPTQDWEPLYTQYLDDESLNGMIAGREATVQQETLDGRAAQGMLRVLQEYRLRGAFIRRELNTVCDSQPDGCVGAEDFKGVVREKLNIQISDDQLDALCEKLFPPQLRRAPYQEMIALLEDKSTYSHNARTIARVRDTNGPALQREKTRTLVPGGPRVTNGSGRLSESRLLTNYSASS